MVPLFYVYHSHVNEHFPIIVQNNFLKLLYIILYAIF